MAWLPPTTVEQRQEIYTQVGLLLNPGYLTAQVRICGKVWTLRSLAPRDYAALRVVTYPEDPLLPYWALALSLLGVDGWILKDLPTPEFVLELTVLPKVVLEALQHCLGTLGDIANKSLAGVIPFCYEGDSRMAWRTLRRSWPTIPGTLGLDLGMNLAQQLWTIFNEQEDDRIHEIKSMKGFNLVTSGLNPKGLEQVVKQDRNDYQEEEDRRQEVMDMYFYQFHGVDIKGLEALEPTLSHMHLDNRTGRYKATTLEEMEEEIRRQVAGEEDFHDMVIRSWKQEVTRRKEEIKAQYGNKALEPIEEAEEPATTLVPTTKFPERRAGRYIDYDVKQDVLLSTGIQGFRVDDEGKIIPADGFAPIVIDPNLPEPEGEQLAGRKPRIRI